MEKVTSQLLPWIPFVPLVGALIMLFLRRNDMLRRLVFLAATAVGFALAVITLFQVNTAHDARPIALTAWNDYLYVDGLTALMLTLVFLLVSGVGLYSFAFLERMSDRGTVTEGAHRLYYCVLLVFAAAMSWTLSFNNLVFVFLALEVSTISTAFLVSLYRTRSALEAAFKYNLLVVAAVMFALLGTILIYGTTTDSTASLTGIHLDVLGQSAKSLPIKVAVPVVAFFITAFGTKSGMIPFHAWLPDAHSEAPAPISALLSGIVITIGAYCVARTITMFAPHMQAMVVLIAAIASASIVIGILMAIVQDDLKRLLAYSSVSQIAYIFEGLALGVYLGIYGGLFHAVTHMLAKSLLFFCAGAIIYQMGLRKISDLGGLGKKMPITATCFFIGALSLGGMPLFGGFMSKGSIILAVGQQKLWWAMGLSAFAGLLTLACMVWAAWRVFWGEESAKVKEMVVERRELPLTMKIPMVLTAASVVFIGVYPQSLYPFLDSATRSVLALLARS